MSESLYVWDPSGRKPHEVVQVVEDYESSGSAGEATPALRRYIRQLEALLDQATDFDPANVVPEHGTRGHWEFIPNGELLNITIAVGSDDVDLFVAAASRLASQMRLMTYEGATGNTNVEVS